MWSMQPLLEVSQLTLEVSQLTLVRWLIQPTRTHTLQFSDAKLDVCQLTLDVDVYTLTQVSICWSAIGRFVDLDRTVSIRNV